MLRLRSTHLLSSRYSQSGFLAMQRTVDSFIERISHRGEVPLASVWELEKLIGMKFSTLDEEADAVITVITVLIYLH